MIDTQPDNYLTLGLRTALDSVAREKSILAKHRQGVEKARAWLGQQHLRLHLGCGPKIKAGWINVDLSTQADITLDMREPFPFEAGCCAVIYSEHFLEHVDYPQATLAFLAECYRMLEPGGLFSVGVPDTEWPLAEYVGTSKQGYFNTAKQRWHPAWCQTEMEHLNYHFRQGDEHRFAYDLKTLTKVLASSGFTNIQSRAFDAQLDSADRQLGTLYVDAYKPTQHK